MRPILIILMMVATLALGEVITENQNITVSTNSGSSCTVLAPNAKLTVSGPFTFSKAASAEKGNLSITLDDGMPQPTSWKGNGKPLVVINLAPRQKLPEPLHIVLTVSPSRKIKEGTVISVIKTQGETEEEIARTIWRSGQVVFDVPGEAALIGVFTK
jgi:hypothetical protein